MSVPKQTHNNGIDHRNRQKTENRLMLTESTHCGVRIFEGNIDTKTYFYVRKWEILLHTSAMKVIGLTIYRLEYYVNEMCQDVDKPEDANKLCHWSDLTTCHSLIEGSKAILYIYNSNIRAVPILKYTYEIWPCPNLAMSKPRISTWSRWRFFHNIV